MSLNKNNISIEELEKVSLFSGDKEKIITKFTREDAKSYSFLWYDKDYYISLVKRYNQKEKLISDEVINWLRDEAIEYNKKTYPTHMESLSCDLF